MNKSGLADFSKATELKNRVETKVRFFFFWLQSITQEDQAAPFMILLLVKLKGVNVNL